MITTNYNINKITITLLNPNIFNISKRFMMSSRSLLTKHAHNYTCTTLSRSRPCLSGIPRRHYPGKLRIVEYDKNGQPVTGSGKSIPNHETYHKNLQEVESGKIYGGFTTHPKSSQTNYHYISAEKLDGTIDPKSTGQHLGVYENPKIVTDVQIIKVLPEHQAYLDKNEPLLLQIISPKKDIPCTERTSKQDSKFYNEDGTRDYDNFQGKW